MCLALPVQLGTPCSHAVPLLTMPCLLHNPRRRAPAGQVGSCGARGLRGGCAAEGAGPAGAPGQRHRRGSCVHTLVWLLLLAAAQRHLPFNWLSSPCRSASWRGRRHSWPRMQRRLKCGAARPPSSWVRWALQRPRIAMADHLLAPLGRSSHPRDRHSKSGSHITAASLARHAVARL